MVLLYEIDISQSSLHFIAAAEKARRGTERQRDVYRETETERDRWRERGS